jgi:hypothetical protein
VTGEAPAARPPRTAIVVAGALALQALLLLWPAALAGEAYFRRDVHLMWYAQADAYARAWHEGSWPLWNPAASFGQPMLADANNQILYPPTPLLTILRPWTYYSLYVFLHLWLAGAGASVLGRRLGLGWRAAWAAGALWMASGPLLSLIDTWNQMAGAAWMPWAVAAGLATLAGGGMRAALGWAAVTTLQLLAGSPEMALLATMGVAVLAAAHARRRHLTPERLRGAAGWSALAVVFTLGLGAGQWVPALDAARRAGRTALPYEARTHWSIHPVNMAQVVLPVPLHRLALTAPTRQQLFGAPDPFLPSIYCGTVGAALVAVALAHPTRRHLGLAAVGLLAGLLAMGRHAGFYDALVAAAPPLQAFRYPAKTLLLAALAWCLLCGSALESANDAGRRRWLAISAGSLALCAAAVAALFTLDVGSVLQRFLAPTGVEAARGAGARMGATALLAAVAGALAVRRPGRWRQALVVVGLCDLALAHHDLNPSAPVALFARRPPALETALDPERGRLLAWDYLEPGASRRDLGREIPYLLARAPSGWDLRAAQALALRDALFPPTAAPWGADGSYDRDVPGLEPMPLARLKTAFRAASADGRLRLLRVGAVSRVAALHAGAGDGLQPLGRYDGYFVDPVLVFAVPHPLPRVYVVGTARVEADDRRALTALLAHDFQPEREVLLASGPGGSTAGFAGSSEVRERRADLLRVQTETSGPGWAVSVDAWDPGWRVSVDGRPAVLDRANLAFRAVALPAGRHQVEFAYHPSLIPPALWTSCLSLLAFAACALAARVRRVPSERPVSRRSL